MKLVLGLVFSLCVVGCGAGGRNGGGGGSGGSGGGGSAGAGGGGGSVGDMGPCTDVIDVVFVLDVSSSMTFVLDKLNAEIDQVVTRANMLAANAHFGLIAFADNYRLDATGPESGGKVHTAAATLKAAFQNYKNVYTLNDRNPGDDPVSGPTQQNPICEENALDSLHAAAAEFPWRDNATRVVIVVTDDTFLERADNYGDRDGDGKITHFDYPSEGNYPALWTGAETTDALKSKRARVFGFTRLKEPGTFDATKCGTMRRLPWSSITDGWSTPYKSAMPIPAGTDGKNFDLDMVKSGALSLTATINEVVVQSFCNPPIY
jgi:hypothetical protein